MNIGVFSNGHPRARLRLQGTHGEFTTEFVIDTGFEGDLALPRHVAIRLEGEPIGYNDRMLADGSRLACPVYEVSILWDDELRSVEALVLEGAPLIGTTFLEGYLLQVEMTEGGDVEATPL